MAFDTDMVLAKRIANQAAIFRDNQNNHHTKILQVARKKYFRWMRADYRK